MIYQLGGGWWFIRWRRLVLRYTECGLWLNLRLVRLELARQCRGLQLAESLAEIVARARPGLEEGGWLQADTP